MFASRGPDMSCTRKRIPRPKPHNDSTDCWYSRRPTECAPRYTTNGCGTKNKIEAIDCKPLRRLPGPTICRITPHARPRTMEGRNVLSKKCAISNTVRGQHYLRMTRAQPSHFGPRLNTVYLITEHDVPPAAGT